MVRDSPIQETIFSLVASAYTQAQDVQKTMQDNDEEMYLQALRRENRPRLPLPVTEDSM